MPTIILFKPDVFQENKWNSLYTQLFEVGIIRDKFYPKPWEDDIWGRVTLLMAHYREHQGKDFFDKLMSFMLSGEIHAFEMYWSIAEGRQWLEKVRWKRTGPRNLAHASDSEAAYEREKGIWF